MAQITFDVQTKRRGSVRVVMDVAADEVNDLADEMSAIENQIDKAFGSIYMKARR